MTNSHQATLNKLANMADVEQYITVHPGSSANEISAALDMSQTSVSRHIKPLWKAKRLTCLPSVGRGSGVSPTRYIVTPDQIPFEQWAGLPPGGLKRKVPAKQEPKAARDPLVAALFGVAQCRPAVDAFDGALEPA